MSPGEEPGETERDPDRDGDPTATRAGDPRGEAVDAHGGSLIGRTEGVSTGLKRFRRSQCEHTFPFDQRREMPQFDAYEDLIGKWRWRLLGADGRTVATAGESYDSHWRALRAAEDVR